jgi:hypothetical protein
VTSASEPEHAIFLLPLEDAEPEPLRRWLGREAWLKDPVVSLRYEPEGDRIIFRVIETPSTAWGFFGAEHPPDPDAELFIGFDGADARAWPTTIALLGFGRHCDQGTTQVGIARELVGNKVWAAALSLREAPGGERELTLSRDEAAKLISRWSDLVEDADAALAEWSAATVLEARPAAGRSTPPGSPGKSHVFYTAPAEAARVGVMSPSRGPGYSSVEGGRYAGWHSEEPEATGAGAAMARWSRSVRHDESSGPHRYGLLTRLADIWAARRDGNAGMPPLPTTGAPLDPADARHGITPYMEVRNRHFLDWAERERRQMLIDVKETKRRRAEVRQQIAGADDKAASIRKALENMPDAHPEPDRRNVVEQNAHETLIHARRRREWDAKRQKLQALGNQAAEAADRLREHAAELTEMIAAREQILDSQVRQLHQHSLRRCATYMRHIVHHHPDGNAVIPYLRLTLPTLPDWLPSPRADGAEAAEQDGS